jgi:hypothetical protein
MLSLAHTAPLAIVIVCVLFPIIAAQSPTKVKSCSFPGVTCKTCVFRYESGINYKKSSTKCVWCESKPTNPSDPAATDGVNGYCLSGVTETSSGKCGFNSKDAMIIGEPAWCDNTYIPPVAIYAPICGCAMISALICNIWASAWAVSRQIKLRMIIIGLLLPIVSLFVVQYLHRKGHIVGSAPTEQSSPETQVHAIEPVSGAELQGLDPSVSSAELQGQDPSSLKPPYKSSPEEIQAL